MGEMFEPAAKKARVDSSVPVKVQPPSSAVQAKEELLAKGGAHAPGMLAAKQETQEPSPLDQLLAAADAFAAPVAGGPPSKPVSTPLTKKELLDPSSRAPPATTPGASADSTAPARMAKEEVTDTGNTDPLAVPSAPMKRIIAPKKVPAPKEEVENPPVQSGGSHETFTAVQLMAKKVDELRALCKERGLVSSGRKQEL